MEIGLPKIDASTVALVKFDQNGLVDLCSKVSWVKNGTQKIVDDAGVGKAMVSNGCYYKTDSYAFGTNTTMEAWVWVQSGTGQGGFGHMQCDSTFGTSIGVRGGRIYFIIEGADTDTDVTSGWHHIAITCQSDKTSKRFVDGRLLDTKTSPKTLTTSGILEVGKGYDGVLNDNVSKIAFVRFSSCIRYTGNFDPFKVWNGGKDSINFDNIFPYNAIKDVTIDGQAMIWYPKTYVRAIELSSGKYKGKYAWQISPYPEEGFHVHRAFIDSSGKERDGFFLGKYEACNKDGVASSIKGETPWRYIGFNDASNAVVKRNTNSSVFEKREWHIQTCFEYWFVSLLMLIELGYADVYNFIGTGGIGGPGPCGSTSAVWRGLYEHWSNNYEWGDGIKTDENGIVQVWDRTGAHFVSTGKKFEDKGLARGSTSNYDFSDMFVPANDGNGNTFSATTSDTLNIGTTSNAYFSLGGYWYLRQQNGMFHILATPSGDHGDGIGFRMAKY